MQSVPRLVYTTAFSNIRQIYVYGNVILQNKIKINSILQKNILYKKINENIRFNKYENEYQSIKFIQLNLLNCATLIIIISI